MTTKAPKKPAAKKTAKKAVKKPAPKKKPKKASTPKQTAADAIVANGKPGLERPDQPTLTRTQAAIRAEELARSEAERNALAVLDRFESSEELEKAMGKFLDIFAAVALKIRTKQGGPLWPLVMNPIQMDYLEGLRQLFTNGGGDLFRGIRDLIVKPRQLGFSTFIAALYFMDGFLEPGRITVIVTHDDRISEELLRTYKLFYDELPEEMKQGITLSKAAAKVYELEFDGQPEKSRFEIRTEKGNPWRGGVIHNLHASEAAFYDGYAAFMASYVQAVPATGNVIFETTTNGKNEFYEEVMLAEEGLSNFRVIFYPWFMHPEYRMEWDPLKQPPISSVRPAKNVPSEAEVMKSFGLDLEQMAWRRFKQKELKSTFPQEYPETLLGAFLATGRPFFDPAGVALGHETAKFSNRVHPGREPRAFVTIYQDPIPGEIYVCGADVAEGIDKGEKSGEDKGGNDRSAAYVIHARTLRTVAKVHGFMPPVEYARILDRLGRLYNGAVMGVERNNHGHTVIAALEQAEYPAVYRHVEYNQANQRYLKPGFPTNVQTRPMILDSLDEVIRSGTHGCPDERFWRECDRFVRNPKTGKPEAMEGWHDDCVIGKAIAIYLCTLGRNGWGLDAPIGSDAAGFPQTAEAAFGLPPVAPPEPEPAPAGAAAPSTPLNRMRQARQEAQGPDPNLLAKAPNGLPLPKSLTPQGAAAGERVYHALTEHKVRMAKTCDRCEHFQSSAPGNPAFAFCKMLRMKIQAQDPGCDRWSEVIVEDEDATLQSDFSGGEQWT